MKIKKDAYIKLANTMKVNIDELLDLIFKDDNKQIMYINRLYKAASCLGVAWEYYNDVFNFIKPEDVEKEIRNIRNDNKFKFKIIREKDGDDKANWVLRKYNNSLNELIIVLLKEGIIYCDCGGYSTSVALPKDMEWFIKDWANGTLET